MKKIKLLLGVLVGLIVSSCSSDDTNEQIETSTIIGEWELVSKSIGASTIQLEGCEQGEGVVFSETLIANFIVVDYEDLEPNIIKEDFENCDFRHASFNFIVSDNNEFLYTIVEGEGSTENTDDSITTYEIEILSSDSLRIKSIANSSTGGIEDVQTNSIEIEESKQITYLYTRK